ncbi:beta-ketoacyl synthase chain length factor [Aliikangiella maris]|uniref:Beta-ketoacyl synthase chain length factor n=2 Tax=Aliikangiella maris TaxID=3162458 RepID=A0ABV2BUB7_9GAMM
MSMYIYDWSVVSPLAVGKEKFIEKINQLFVHNDLQFDEAFRFEAFNRKDYLGKKGVRNMDELGAYATTASKLIVDSHLQAFANKNEVGVILGTATGSIKSQVDFIRDIHEQEMIEWINPIQFPQTVMNCAAGQVSIWHQFTGVNTTISGGYQSTVSAFEYAANCFKNTRVKQLLVGGVEEYSDYSQALLPKEIAHQQVLGEGCALFWVGNQSQSATDTQLLLSKRYAYFNRLESNEIVDKLAKEIHRILDNHRIESQLISHICFNQFTTRESQIVTQLNQALTNGNAKQVCSNDYLADCLSATSGLQLALLLADNSYTKQENSIAISVTFDPRGRVGLIILKTGEQQ